MGVPSGSEAVKRTLLLLALSTAISLQMLVFSMIVRVPWVRTTSRECSSVPPEPQSLSRRMPRPRSCQLPFTQRYTLQFICSTLDSVSSPVITCTSSNFRFSRDSFSASSREDVSRLLAGPPFCECVDPDALLVASVEAAAVKKLSSEASRAGVGAAAAAAASLPSPSSEALPTTLD